MKSGAHVVPAKAVRAAGVRPSPPSAPLPFEPRVPVAGLRTGSDFLAEAGTRTDAAASRVGELAVAAGRLSASVRVFRDAQVAHAAELAALRASVDALLAARALADRALNEALESAELALDAAGAPSSLATSISRQANGEHDAMKGPIIRFPAELVERVDQLAVRLRHANPARTWSRARLLRVLVQGELETVEHESDRFDEVARQARGAHAARAYGGTGGDR